MTSLRIDGRLHHVSVVTAALLSAIALAVVQWQAGPLLTNDGHQHMYAAFVATHVDEPNFPLRGAWDIRTTLSSHGFSEVFFLLHRVLDWEMAYRVAMLLVLELSAFAGFFLVVRMDRGRAWLGLVAFPAALQWVFYFGFFPFSIATSLSLCILALWIPTSRVSWRSSLLLALATCLVCTIHIIGAAFFFAAVSFLVLWNEPRAIGRLVLPALVIGAFLSVLTSATGDDGLTWTWLPWNERLAQSVNYFIPGPWWRSAMPALLMILGVGAALWRGTSADRALATAGVCFFLATLALPHTGPWQWVSPRPLSFAFPLIVAAFPVEKMGARARVLANVSAVAWCSAALFWGSAFHRDVRVRLAPFEALLHSPAPRTTGTLLSINLLPSQVPEVRGLDPLLAFGQILAVAWTQVAGNTWTGSSDRFVLVHREDASIPYPRSPALLHMMALNMVDDPEEHARGVAMIAAQALAYDEVFVAGPPEDLALVERLGLRPRLRGERFLVGSAPLCPVHASVESVSKPAKAFVGVGGAAGESYRWRLRGPLSADVSLPCGPVWLEVQNGSCVGASNGLIEGEALPGQKLTLSCKLAQ